MTYTGHIDTFAADNLPPRSQWPEFIFELPELRYPARLNCAAELLDRTVASGHADRPVIHSIHNGARYSWTYRQLLTRANQIAHVIEQDMKLVPGTRVLLRGFNNPMMFACWFGVIKAGCIAVATMPLLRARELKQIIGKAKISAALCDIRLSDELELAQSQCAEMEQVLYFGSGLSGSLEDLLKTHPAEFENVDTAAEDVALIAFTSGTTGQPKGTMHFHRDVMAMSDYWPRSFLKATSADICCGTPPIAFTFGLGSLVAFPMRFASSVVLVESERLTPDILLQTIQDFKATICFTAPTYYRQIAGLVKNYELSSLKNCVSAGEALPDSTRQLFKNASGIEIIDAIGSTEMSHIFVSHTPERVRRGATGYAVPGYRVAVLDDSGQPCSPGVVGRLAVKGPTGCRYLSDERQQSQVVDGWNITGDACKMDEDGYLYFQARNDDMIVSAGYNISGLEVEATLLEHDAVAECGIVGAPDDARGQIVKAFLVLNSGYPADEQTVRALQDFVKAKIAPYKYPRKIVFRDSLPRTPTGKLQRFKLRDQD